MRSIAVVYFVSILVGIWGWVLNLIALVHALHGPVDAMFLARLAGVPLFVIGAILGFI